MAVCKHMLHLPSGGCFRRPIYCRLSSCPNNRHRLASWRCAALDIPLCCRFCVFGLGLYVSKLPFYPVAVKTLLVQGGAGNMAETVHSLLVFVTQSVQRLACRRFAKWLPCALIPKTHNHNGLLSASSAQSGRRLGGSMG